MRNVLGAARHRSARLVIGAIPILVGCFLSFRKAWVCDDAFISFRYIDHLERGFGLVYNPGERVEGYTHFLWVILLAAIHRTGIDLVELGRYLPLFFHAGILTVLVVWSARSARPAELYVPIAAWAVALHPDMQIWASGGLETAAFTCCVTAAVLLASRANPNPGLAATLTALATLFRPEGLLVTVCVAAWLAWRWRDVRLVARFAAVWLALVAPLVAWRAFYYHDWLPNTFYAKSAALARWDQGWRYVAAYFWTYPVLAIALLVAIVVGWFRSRTPNAAMPLCAAVSLALLLYVLRLGGDFMFARFLVPITPLLFISLEEALRRLRPAAQALAGGILAVGVGLSGWQRERILASDFAEGVADEHAVYPRRVTEERRRQGESMAAIFKNLDVRVCILGSQAAFAYFAHFPYVLEKYGLTDRELARRPLRTRGRPGHEKGLTRQDLVDRHVHMFFRGRARDRTGAPDEAIFGDLLASLVFYDRALMDSLQGRPGVEFLDFPAFLDSTIGRMGEMPPESKRSLADFAAGYYFEHNHDEERQARFRAALQEVNGSQAKTR